MVTLWSVGFPDASFIVKLIENWLDVVCPIACYNLIKIENIIKIESRGRLVKKSLGIHPMSKAYLYKLVANIAEFVRQRSPPMIGG